MLLPGHPVSVIGDVFKTLTQALDDLPAATVFGPFLDLALEENVRYLERLPDLVTLHQDLCPTLQLATMENGWSEWVLDALSFALAAAASSGRRGVLILSANDCDRRAFGLRVHPEAVVIHHKGRSNAELASFAHDNAWIAADSVDLPSHPSLPQARPADRFRMLGPGSDPSDIRALIHEDLLDGMRSGARQHLVLTIG